MFGMQWLFRSAAFLIDYTTGNVNPLIGGGTVTYTRAGAVATRLNEYGLRVTCPANTARIDYYPGGAYTWAACVNLVGSKYTSPDSAAASVTGDIEIEVEAALDNWASGSTQCLLTKDEDSGAGASRSWGLYVNTDGSLLTEFSTDGSTNINLNSTAIPGFALAQRVAIKVGRVAATGAITYSTAPSIDGPWTQLGTPRAGAAGNLFDSAKKMNIGQSDPSTFITTGKIFRARVRNGISGPVVVDFDPTRYAGTAGGGVGTITAATGEVWTINGQAFIGRMNAIKGNLIEPGRQNIALQANALGTAPWTDLGTPAAAQNAWGSDGTISAWTLTDNDAGIYEGKSQSITVANDSSIYAIGANVRKTFGGTSATVGMNTSLGGGTAQFCHPRLNTDTGAFVNVGANGSAYVEDHGDWWRLFAVITNNTSGNVTLQAQLYPATNTNGNLTDVATATGSAIFERLQVEIAPDSKGTSYIDTAAVAVTRNVDADNTATGAWYSATEGTIFVEFIPRTVATGAHVIAEIGDGTLNNRITIYTDSAGPAAKLYVNTGGLLQSDQAANGAPVAGVVNRIAAGYKANSFPISLNGAAVSEDFGGTVPTVTTLYLGDNPFLNSVNGWLRKWGYWTPKKDSSLLPPMST